MGFGWLRRRLGVLATFWLCSQALSLSASAFNLCCAGVPEPVADAHAHHGHVTPVAPAAADGANDTAVDAHCRQAVVDHCPMAGSHGEPCPMHGGAAHTGDASTTAGASDSTPAQTACVLRGPCAGTDVSLLTFLWAPAEVTVLAFDVATPPSQALSVPAGITRSPASPVDLPPPRI